MKSIKQMLMTVAVLLCSVTTNAYDFEVDSIYYDIISTKDLTVKVTSGDNSYRGEVVIPSTITYKSRTLTVVSIGDDAFKYCSRLTKVTIPNSVTSIGDCAFYACGITSITIPNSVTSIGNNAFGTLLKDLRIENGETVLSLGYNYYSSSTGRGLFRDSPLETLYLGRNISYKTDSNYGYSPFYNITTLTSVTIGNNVTNIGQSIFRGCGGLTNITIPNSVTTIENWAFQGCTGLKELYIEDGDTILELGYNTWSDKEKGGQGLFYDCPLEKIHLGRTVNYIISISGYNSHSTYPGYPFANRTDLKTLTISNHVTEIKEYAFGGCSSLSEVIIPNSVTSIGYEAFNGCTDLTSLIIGNNVKKIGSSAFRGCQGLTSITIPNSVTEIGFNAFSGCSSLKEICVEDGNSTLCWGNYGTFTHEYFRGCPIEKVYLGRNFSFNGKGGGLFSGTKAAISSLTIGDCVTKIYNRVFYNLTKNVSIYLMSTNPPIIYDCSDEAYVNWNIYVPQGFLAAYQAADVWKNFWNIQEYYLDKYFYINYVINGKPYATDSVKHGDMIIPKEVVVKEGQTFSGWIDLPETMPANDITVYGTINIKPEAILLNKQTIITTVNSAYQLYATIYPEDATDKAVIWTSSDESVAKVSESGYVTGISVGKATITASCGNVSASCEVEVEIENFIKTQPTAENLQVELNTPEEGVEYQWYQHVEGMIYSEKIVPTSTGDYAWTESNGVWTSGNKGSGQTYSVMTATINVQVGDTISFDYTVPAGDGSYSGGSQWFKFTLKGETNFLMFDGTTGRIYHKDFVIDDYYINHRLNEDSTMTIGFECVRTNSERATVSNIKHTRPTGLYKGMVDEKIVGATTARLDDSLFVEGSVVYCVVTLPNGRTLTTDKVNNIYKVYYYVGEELVHVDEVAYGEAIPEYTYEPEEGYTFHGWTGESYETMPAHDVIYTANIESGIDLQIVNGQQLTVIYDLTGRKVTDIQNLKSGVYIINGKKVIVK